MNKDFAIFRSFLKTCQIASYKLFFRILHLPYEQTIPIFIKKTLKMEELVWKGKELRKEVKIFRKILSYFHEFLKYKILSKNYLTTREFVYFLIAL